VSDDPEIAEFIRVYIPSIWTLELLLVLQREPACAWLPDVLVKELRASATLVGDNLALLERHGLALRDAGGWRFGPANSPLALLVTQLGKLYRERPMHVISMISRSDALRSLADAFRIKRDET
jgi:hypothetical protein